MFLRNTEIGRILQQGTEARRYLFSYRTDLERLTASISRDGLLTPPVLRERPDGTLQTVCGSRRIQALKRLGAERAAALVLPPGRDSEVLCLRRSIQENLWHRGFNEVEKALLFTRLQDDFSRFLPHLEDLLQGELRPPREPRSLEPYRFLLALPEPVLTGLAEGRVSLGQVQLLRLFPPEGRVPFCLLMAECELTLQESRQAAEWLLDCSGQGDPLLTPAGRVESLLDLPADRGVPPRKRAQRLLSILRGRRYPVLESWKERFANACAEAGLVREGLRLNHDPVFETTEIRVEIRGRSEAELAGRIEHLSRASAEGRLSALFQALRVE